MSKLFSSFPSSLFCHGNALRDSFGGMNEGMRVYKTEGLDSGKGALKGPSLVSGWRERMERMFNGNRAVLTAALVLGLGSAVACDGSSEEDPVADGGLGDETTDTTGETGGETDTEETGSDGTTSTNTSGDTTDSGTDTSGDTTDSGTDTGMTPEMWFKDAHVDCSKTVEGENTGGICSAGQNNHYFTFEAGPGIDHCKQPIVEFLDSKYNDKEQYPNFNAGECSQQMEILDINGKRVFRGVLTTGNVNDVNVQITVPCVNEGGEYEIEVMIIQWMGPPE